ncbi:MAG: c-type cytochrome [Magnetococcales bacterium]|nr:c-type cytochrome [Magnetococcales bacterium]
MLNRSKKENLIKSIATVRKSAVVTGVALMIAMLAVTNIQKVEAAGMNHGPAGPSPIAGLPKTPNVPFHLGLGMQKFQEHCSECHGQWAEGTADKGPPLVHKYYEPSHHDDGAFFRSVQSGTSAHHWTFGDMEPVVNVTKQDIVHMIKFIRWWQRQNGIN